MDISSAINDFLTTRRAKITPEQAGLATFPGSRRVAGLRRGEVASLAGVSVEYYTRLERGNLRGVSESVLEGLAAALQLDDVEREHLFDLARTANAAGPRTRRKPAAAVVNPTVQRVVDAMVGLPALILNNRFDVLHANVLGRALYADVFTSPVTPVNTARFIFLDPRAAGFYPDWAETAEEAVGALRTAAGKTPFDRDLSNLIGELSTRSDPFRTWWAANDVYRHRLGTKRINHRAVGEMALSFDSFTPSHDTGLSVVAYSAQPGSASEEALALLGSWASTPEQPAALLADIRADSPIEDRVDFPRRGGDAH